ncbi:MAG TPA: Gfo/Idh/MocA family oxidoreductase [Thermoleophilaceae bacterium]|nr:Gfo/Idh/MocA family oxidoreductase [Thermoleophilaceae bacterium]
MGLRAGIAGYGLAGSVFHAPLIEAVDGLEVAAVMTRSAERAEQARAAHADVRVVDSLDALLEDIDVLVVASPNSSHAEIALLGIERGLHVVIDKPMAVSADDAQVIAEAGGERVTVFHNRRWDGDFLTVKRLVDSGELGAITRFESRFERFRPEVKHGWREGGDPAAGGGVLLDLGPHVVDQALQLFGPLRSVYGEVRTLRAAAYVDDDAFIALQHVSGEISHLWMSAIAPLHGPRFRVSGMNAGFASDGLDPQEDQLKEGMRPGDPGFGEKEGLERGNYVAFYEGVRDWMRGEAAAPVDPWDAVRVMDVLEEARG